MKIMKNHLFLSKALIIGALMARTIAVAQEVPEILPRPHQTPPSTGKVKVYVLAGQSNMVGFGYLEGSKPVYPSIYLSADPKIKVGRMPVGPSALLRHGVFQSADLLSPPGAQALIYSGELTESRTPSDARPIRQEVVALGAVDTALPSIAETQTLVVKAWIDVPMSGMHEIHAGYGPSSHAVVTLEGKEVYRKDIGSQVAVTPVFLEKGRRYPIQIRYLQGGSAAFWLKHIELQGQGDLVSLNKEGKYPWFADHQGQWTTRNDVTYWETRISKEQGGSGGPLTVTSNGKFIGPEVPFGYVMGTYHEEPVLLIESSMGNRSLSFDFRPPSSGKTPEEKANEFCGLEYDLMVKGVRETLQKIDQIVPNYAGQGYEMAGFVWFQGHKDKDVPKADYERHLVNLINDLRKEFESPKMPAVVATVGFGGMEMEPGHLMTWQAQMAVSDSQQYPEFQGNVASVDTRPFWRSRGLSPTNTGYHYNHNAETYILTGDALGRAMVRLQGGKVEPLRVKARPTAHPDVAWIFSDEVTGRFNKRGPHYPPDYYREMGGALKPMILDEMVPEFLETALGNQRGSLAEIVAARRPSKMPSDLRGDLDTLIDYYDMAGVDDYQWQPFGNLRKAKWSYHSFNPPETQAREKSDRYREITFPTGMEQWFFPDFQPAKAGWKVGQAPFGRMGEKPDRRRPSCNGSHCGCCELPATFWENEVLLMSQKFVLPAVKKGHAYRLILGGAGCDRSGEGFAVYLNGKLVAQANGGFYRYSGIRGGYLYDEILKELDGGEVTISVINFLRYTHFRNVTHYHGPHPDFQGQQVPPNGHVDLWMEEVKLPPELQKISIDRQD
jgi:hypothetical protein